jgi:molybdate transport system substrate-binding protein
MKRRKHFEHWSFWKTAATTIAFAAVLTSCGDDGSQGAASAVVSVAVAGNFAAPQADLARRFEAATDIRIETSIGATGQLYAQIVNGAPFDVFLAADTARPSRLEEDGFAIPDTRFTYAVGRLVLYAPSWDSVGVAAEELRSRDIRHLAIANPHTAPYGVAALEVLRNWDLEDEYETRIVRGENVGQAFQFVESGAAEAAFIALSQVVDRDERTYLIVSRELHRPIRQDAVLLQRMDPNPHASAYLEFLRSEVGKQVITGFGYSVPEVQH